jgi:hypothetical protein
MWIILCGILPLPYNIVMDLKNVMYLDHLLHLFFNFIILAQIEKSIARKRIKNKTTSGEPTQTKGKSRNNTHMRPNLPRDH